jgi:exodeoxyribonuclease-3
MRIATFNINNVNKRLANLVAWLEAERPDVVCLQELKAEQAAFPLTAISAAGYGAVWRGQRSWNGGAPRQCSLGVACLATRPMTRPATSRRR